MVLGLADRQRGRAKGYVHSDLLSQARSGRLVLNDDFFGEPIVVVYDDRAKLAAAFLATLPEGELTFDAASFAAP